MTLKLLNGNIVLWCISDYAAHTRTEFSRYLR